MAHEDLVLVTRGEMVLRSRDISRMSVFCAYTSCLSPVTALHLVWSCGSWKESPEPCHLCKQIATHLFVSWQAVTFEPADPVDADLGAHARGGALVYVWRGNMSLISGLSLHWLAL